MENNTARTLISCLDLTKLGDGVTENDVVALCREALREPRTAAVCVDPRFCGTAARELAGADVALAAVTNFPEGNSRTETVLREIDQILENGGGEIDYVIRWRDILENDERADIDELKRVVAHADGRIVKVIIESGELGETVSRIATKIAVDCGADFVKTSTGFTPLGADVGSVKAILAAIGETGADVGLKVSGGVRSYDAAKRYFLTAKNALRLDAASPRKRFRIGASSLIDELRARLREPENGQNGDSR